MSVRWNRNRLLQLLAPYLFAFAAAGVALSACAGGAAKTPQQRNSATVANQGRSGDGRALWVGIGTALGALGTAPWMSRRLARRIRRLTEFSRAVTAGLALPPLHADREDLLGGLERDMLVMARSVNARLEAAREEQRKLEAILSGMREGVLVIDASGIIRLSNDCGERIFEIAPGATLVGEPLLKISRDPDLRELFQEVLHGDSGRRLLREMTLNSGTRMQSFRVTATPVPQPDAEPALFILVFHDITELKKLEVVRRDFVANVSHEIRTPLTAIRGYAETLREGSLDNPELTGRFVDIIARHAERLTRLTDDLLILSDLEMGHALLRRASVPLMPVVEAAIDVLQAKAERREVEIRRELPADLPPLHADPDRLEQVLVNLIDNAVKYTAAGGHVRVSARTAPPHPAAIALPADVALRSWIEISVSDTGIGIPSQDLPRLTERFYRVDKARSRELGGTGLGLAIVKHIVLAHGGALRIESELGQGTRVSVCLPAAPVDESSGAQQPPTRLSA